MHALNYKRVSLCEIHVYANELCVGSIYTEIDGFYVYSSCHAGYFESWFLRTIADKLDGMNAEWHAELLNALSKAKEPIEVFDV